jgi:hypothetical protein
LYELEDRELVDLLVQNQARLNLILSTAGSKTTKAKPASIAAAAKAMVKRSKLIENATKKKSIATMAKKSAKKVSAAKESWRSEKSRQESREEDDKEQRRQTEKRHRLGRHEYRRAGQALGLDG